MLQNQVIPYQVNMHVCICSCRCICGLAYVCCWGLNPKPYVCKASEPTFSAPLGFLTFTIQYLKMSLQLKISFLDHKKAKLAWLEILTIFIPAKLVRAVAFASWVKTRKKSRFTNYKLKVLDKSLVLSPSA